MRRHIDRIAILTAIALASGPVGPAPAQPAPPGREGELGRILPPIHDRRVCFSRIYDAAHMRKHPSQKVTAMQFQIRYHRHDPDKQNPEGQRNYYFGMAAKVRGQTKTLHASGECTSSQGKIYCGIDCDGGGVLIERHVREGGLTVKFEDSRAYLRMTLGCGGEEGRSVNLTPGADDRVFHLVKASPSACRRLDD